MFQSGSNISVQDNLTQIPHDDWNPFPKISPHPPSKQLLSFKKEFIKKQHLHLPNLRHNHPNKLLPKTDRYSSNIKKDRIQNILRLQAGKNRKEYGNHSEETRKENKTEESEDIQFQMKIKENREKIRQQKSNGERKKQDNNPSMKKMISKDRLDRNNQKLKFDRKTQKKKAASKRKSTENSVGKNSIKQSFRNIPNKKIHLPPKNNFNQIQYKGKSKSKNLFENLQEFLQNPKKSKKNDEKLLVGLSLLKAKRDLEQKLKVINRKLALKGNHRQKEDMKFEQRTSPSDWRKLSFRDNAYSSSMNSFDVQVDKIGQLQEKIENNLEEFLEYQQLLLEIESRKKLKKSRKKNFQ